MHRISNIGSLLKKNYRLYSFELLVELQNKGFSDLRPSFLELLTFICDTQGPSIKEVGNACGLKKQTMTSHLNELEKRNYIFRKVNPLDKREQNIFLTEYGKSFKLSLTEAISKLEENYVKELGDFEINRIEEVLKNLFREFSKKKELNVEESHRPAPKFMDKFESFKSEVSSISIS